MSDYNSTSEFAPSNFTGSVSASLIESVPNNPAHTGAHAVTFPTYYDEFINKTEGRVDAPIPVVAEKYSSNDIVTVGGVSYLYLHHMPMEANGGSIQLSNGSIDTGSTDYNLGLIKFDTRPTGDFYINYLARADSFAGEHINALQNAVMTMQRIMGAGSITGEGIRNAELWVDSWPASLQSFMPNAISVRESAKDLKIAGDETGAINITIGNGADTLTNDVANWNVTSSDVAQAISGDFGDDSDDVLVIRSLVHFNATGGSALGYTGVFNNIPYMFGDPNQSIWTGASAGPYSLPYSDTGSYPLAQFNGDVVIVGDIFVSGNILAISVASGEQVSSINETLAIGTDLRVTGNSYLNGNVDIGGYGTIGDYLHVQGLSNDISRIDTAIWMRNQGNASNGLGGPYADTIVPAQTKYLAELPFHLSQNAYSTPGPNTDLTVNKVSHVDGLDPSYIAKLLAYRAHGRSDFKNNMVNVGSYDGFTGLVTSVAGAGTSQWNDTGMAWPTGSLTAFSASTGFTGVINNVGRSPFRWHHMGGDYYHGKFGNEIYNIASGEFSGDYQYGEGNQWLVLWTNDDTAQPINAGAKKFGARIPLDKVTIDYYTGSPYVATGVLVQLSRPFNTPVAVNDNYKLYHPKNSMPNAISKDDATTIRVSASMADPLIATVDGITKVLETDCTESITSSYTGMHYVFMDCRTPETAKQYGGHLLETEPTVVIKTTATPDDSQVIIGEFYSTDPGSGIDESSIITYRYNAEYDTLWTRANDDENTFGLSASEFSYRASTLGLSGDSTGLVESPADYVFGTNFGDALVINENEYRIRIQHNFGDLGRAMNADLRLFVAPNLGEAYGGHGTGSFAEGPDYAYARELEHVKYDQDAGPAVTYACYDILHTTRNYTDIALYEMDKVPGGIIGSRATGATNKRNLALTGSAGVTDLDASGVDERERKWWWFRATMG